MEAAVVLDYKALYEEQKAQNEALQLTVATLRHELDQLKKMIYGSRHERFVPESLQMAQLTLDLAVETVAPETQTKEVTYSKTISDTSSKKIEHPGRSPLPAHLRREETILEPANITEGSKKIGEEVTEELEYTPGELFVKKYIRPKYLLPLVSGTVNAEIIIAPMPIRPLEKAIAGPGLLAQVVIDKYVDHLPLYRQMQRFERAGVKIAYSTLTDWVSGTCNLITPLYEALKAEVLKSGYIHCDETPIKVLDNDKKGKTHRGYFWVYNNSPGKMVFFDYQQGRDSKGPEGILKDYKGYLQTDGYQVCATCKVVRLIVPFSLSEYSGTRFSVSGSLLRHAWLVTTGYEARRTMYRKLKSCLPQSDKRKNHRTSLMDRARLVGMANVK